MSYDVAWHKRKGAYKEVYEYVYGKKTGMRYQGEEPFSGARD